MKRAREQKKREKRAEKARRKAEREAAKKLGTTAEEDEVDEADGDKPPESND